MAIIPTHKQWATLWGMSCYKDNDTDYCERCLWHQPDKIPEIPKEDEAFVICARTADLSQQLVTPESIKVECCSCKVEVWAAAFAQGIIKQGGKPICLGCAMATELQKGVVMPTSREGVPVCGAALLFDDETTTEKVLVGCSRRTSHSGPHCFNGDNVLVTWEHGGEEAKWGDGTTTTVTKERINRRPK